MDSLVIETAIGLVFVFAAFAALVSVLTEGVTRFVGLRGEYLLRGIRTLVDGPGHFELTRQDLLRRASAAPQPRQGEADRPLVTRIMEHPLVSAGTSAVSQPRSDDGREAARSMPAEAGNTKLSNKLRRRVPSYVSSRAFARALLDTLVPDAAGATTMTQVRAVLAEADLPDVIRRPLLALAVGAGEDITTFRTSVEQWYDDHMARVSGWYKRHVRWISMGLAAVLVLLFNLNTLTIARSIYSDQALRGSVVTEATQASQCTGKTPADCLKDLRSELDQARTAGLPIGWGTVPDCVGQKCSWAEQEGLVRPHASAGQALGDVLVLLVGWVLMVIALTPGARFWFDVLGRLGTLRTSGPRPRTT